MEGRPVESAHKWLMTCARASEKHIDSPNPRNRMKNIHSLLPSIRSPGRG
ncbi:hypothetical protein [Sporosarcina sp. 6E9]|nr:hypothetical protein [Sporosarcina sp. 6E9]